MSAVLLLALVHGTSGAAEKYELKSEAARMNYSVGYQIGGDFKSQGVELDQDALVQGIRDALGKSEPLLTQEQMNSTLVALKKKILAAQRDANKRTDAEFLEENAKKKDVTVLASGVQYKVLKDGKGKKPTMKDEVKVNYIITRTDGKELGSTYVGGKPRTYQLSKAIPALQEVLPLMQEGAKWQVVIPPSRRTMGDRDPLDDMGVLVYDLELIKVKSVK